MQVSAQTQAVLLLTAHFSKPNAGGVKPLTPTEWGRFALWLKDGEKEPEVLLRGNLREMLSGWSDRQVTEDRVKSLLDRGPALAIAMEKWQRSGLWILTRSDADYPKNLKRRLKTASPPVLFGCGNAKLLNQKGIAVVGSRNASREDLDFAADFGAAAANAGYGIVSGGARGIDEAAMLGALDMDGTAVGYLADSLLRACTSQKYRSHLSRRNLVLVSSYYPEAGFNAGNAMGRNKYIYCAAEAAVVVHSGRKGGTWSGALENLTRGWVPVWVRRTADSSAGNADIVAKGAQWAPEQVSSETIPGLTDQGGRIQVPRKTDDLLQRQVREPVPEDAVTCAGPRKTRDNKDDSDAEAAAPRQSASGASLYDVFLSKLEAECARQALTLDEIAERLGLQKAQLNIWLKQAVTEKKLRKLTQPVRYEWQGQDAQRSMFDD